MMMVLIIVMGVVVMAVVLGRRSIRRFR